MSFETDTHPIRVCPNCGSEFQPHVVECLDCGAATVAAWEGATSGAGASAPSLTPRPKDPLEPRAEGFTVTLRVGDVAWLRPLVARLGKEGIESRLVPHPEKSRSPSLIVLVRPEDEERARQIELKVYVKQLPDLPASLNRGTTDACPACGAKVTLTTSECPDCGLVIWEDPAGGEEMEDEPRAEIEDGVGPFRLGSRPGREE